MQSMTEMVGCMEIGEVLSATINMSIFPSITTQISHASAAAVLMFMLTHKKSSGILFTKITNYHNNTLAFSKQLKIKAVYSKNCKNDITKFAFL